MKTYKNELFTVVFEDETNFTVTNKFGDTYKCKLVDGKISSKSRFGLQYARRARSIFGF